jgi:hypothetical protein
MLTDGSANFIWTEALVSGSYRMCRPWFHNKSSYRYIADTYMGPMRRQCSPWELTVCLFPSQMELSSQSHSSHNRPCTSGHAPCVSKASEAEGPNLAMRVLALPSLHAPNRSSAELGTGIRRSCLPFMLL